MRCLKCNVDTKRKHLRATTKRCPGCGHTFVADKKADGISDQGIQKAIEKVSERHTRHFLPGQLEYELRRRLRVRPRRFGAAEALGLLVTILGLGVGLAAESGVFQVLGFVAAVAAGLWTGRLLLIHRDGRQLGKLVQRFLAVNPTPSALTDIEDLTRQMQAFKTQGPHPRYDKVLLCQHRNLADFFWANHFHLHHACAVVGPAGYGIEYFEGLAKRLRASDAAGLILVLHDFSPRGEAFLRAVEGNPDWLSFGSQWQVLDAGLNASHQSMLRGVSRPATEFDRTSPGLAGSRANQARMGAEVAALAPLVLFTAAGAAVDTGGPMHLPQQESSTDGGG